MKMEERIDRFSPLGLATGRTQLRSQPLAEDCWYQVVLVWTRDKSGRLLLTRRSGEKQFFPNCWEVTQGMALAGEGPYDAAHRELREETGLEAPDPCWRRLGRLWQQSDIEGRHYQSMVDVYLVTLTEEQPPVCCQPEEVSESRWMTAEEYLAIPEEEHDGFSPACFRRFCDNITEPITKKR